MGRRKRLVHIVCACVNLSVKMSVKESVHSTTCISETVQYVKRIQEHLSSYMYLEILFKT
jgi:hypothetical protein